MHQMQAVSPLPVLPYGKTSPTAMQDLPCILIVNAASLAVCTYLKLLMRPVNPNLIIYIWYHTHLFVLCYLILHIFYKKAIWQPVPSLMYRQFYELSALIEKKKISRIRIILYSQKLTYLRCFIVYEGNTWKM